MKKILEALFYVLPAASLVTALGCFFRMMFYTNTPKSMEIAMYVSLGIMFVYMIGFFVVASDDDVEY